MRVRANYPEKAEFSQQVSEKMLNISIDLEKTYLKNAAKLYGELKGDDYYKAGKLKNWVYDTNKGTMVIKTAIGGATNF